MTEFIFKNEDISVAKYEYVKLLKATPKNPKDYEDMEQILRHRQTMQVKELYGDCRIDNGQSPFIINGSNRVEASGLWYLDGYRISLDGLTSTQTVNLTSNYKIYLLIRFREVTYKDDPSIALQDGGTDRLIETSRRVDFEYSLEALLTNIDEVPEGWDAAYLIATLNSGSFSDATNELTVINLNYSEAIAIINNAVHKEFDNKTVEIERVVTSLDGSARAVLEKLSDTKLRLGFEDSAQNTVSAYEMVYENGVWNPILWMTPGSSDYPTSYMTPNGFNVFDELRGIGKYASKELSVGDNFSSLSVTPERLKLTLAGREALKSERHPVNITNRSAAANILTAETQEQTGISDPLFEKGARVKSGLTTGAQTAAYTLTIPDGTLPNDGTITINHKILHDAASYSNGILTARVYSKPEGGSYELRQETNFSIQPGNVVINEPLKAIVTNPITINPVTGQEVSQDILDINYVVKVVYSIDSIRDDGDDISAVVGLKTGENITWFEYSEVHTSVSADVVRMGNALLWIDADENLRLKSVEGYSDMGVAIKEMKDNAAGDLVTSPGGLIVNNNGFEGVNISTDQEMASNALAEEPFYYSEDNSIYFPNAAQAFVSGGGLITNAQWQDIWQAIANAGSGYARPDAKGFAIVSDEWEGTAAAYPFFSSISSAVDHLRTNYGGGTVLAIKGTFTENINIGGLDINIVSYGKEDVKLKGNIYDNNVAGRAFIDIPVENGDANLVYINTNESHVEFGPNASITAASISSTPIIQLYNGSVTINCRVNFDLSGTPGIIAKNSSSVILRNTSVINQNIKEAIVLEDSSTLAAYNSIIKSADGHAVTFDSTATVKLNNCSLTAAAGKFALNNLISSASIYAVSTKYYPAINLGISNYCSADVSGIDINLIETDHLGVF